MHDGQCVCNKGWSGADCSQKAYLLTSFYSKKFSVNGTSETLFEYREGIFGGERWELVLSSQMPLTVYINTVSEQG
jgi:hypothetical protein